MPVLDARLSGDEASLFVGDLAQVAKYLVIVESPAKAKTIEKFLGRNYIVRACFGAVRDLPKSQMGVDIEHNFEPKYIVLREERTRNALKEIKDKARKVEKVFLASDPDREGEAIAWHVSEILKANKTTSDIPSVRIIRPWPNAM